MAPVNACIRLVGATVLATFVGLSAAGCSGSQPATASAAAQAPSATPAAGGDQVMAAAALAYGSAADTAKLANAALAAQFSGSLTLAQTQDYYRQAAAVDSAFMQSIKLITYPAGAAADEARLVTRVTADEDLDLRISNAATFAGAAADAKLRPADLAALAVAGNAVRTDLGLPALP
jgi:hypothetical protein